MRNTIVIAALLAVGLSGGALAEKSNSSDRTIGTELNRERAETRIERLRQDQRQNEQKQERNTSRAQKLPNKTQQPSR